MRTLVCACLLLLVGVPVTWPASDHVLVIGTKEAPPFSMKNRQGQWEGIAIDLWRSMADELGWRYEFRELTLDEMLQGVASNQLDAAVAAITVTATRERVMDFSHPFYTTGYGIAVSRRAAGPHWLEVARSFFSAAFLKVLITLGLVLLGAGLLVWLFERRHPANDFGHSFWSGLGNGLWWSAVTMTTVGYGDKAPRTVGGRMVAVLWMFTSVVIISSFTATMTSTLAVGQLRSLIRNVDDLARVRVATVTGTTSADYLEQLQINHTDYASIQQALEALTKGEADAVVYDAPILRYLVTHGNSRDVEVLPQVFGRQDYGIALPLNSPLRQPLNRVLLEKINSEEWGHIKFRYLGRT